MKLEIEPYREEDSDDDPKSGLADGINGANGASEVEKKPKKIDVLKCEVREYEARYNLKGEQSLKLVMEDEKKKNEDDEDDSDKYALRSEKWYDRNGTLYHTLLEIHAVQIREALQAVIEECPGVNLRANPICLYDKPKCVFHYRHELAQYRDNVNDPMAKMYVSLLLRYLHRELGPQIRSYQVNVEGTPENPMTSFNDVWTVFKPGDLVVTGDDEARQILKLRETYESGGASPTWVIVGWGLAHDGQSYGYVERSFSISSFDGAKSISKLSIHPLKYSKTAKEDRLRLIARGKKYCDLVGCHYRSYTGIALRLGDKRDTNSYGQLDSFPLETTMIDGRIMVDSKMFAVFKAPNRIQFEERRTTDPGLKDPTSNLCEDDFVIFRPSVCGFSLVTKKWCMFYVELIRPAELNIDAFNYLLLPKDQKDIVYALVETHSKQDGGFDDMIKGKGKGCIFVLHGQPGVGKTFTAESVADHLQRPLYVLHSGELGITPESVETNLTNALMLATTWNAVLLIDEADVFLEQRTVQDLHRNCLVSLFLRILEYYEGIMFLTTNRIVTFDLAFKSRVHLALKYNALDVPQRTELWKLFLSRVPSAAHKTWSGTDLEELAAMTLNGRQIKNAVRTANSLAIASGKELSQSHLRIVLKTMRDFEDDLNENTQDPTCFTPKMIRRQSTLLSRLSMTEEPEAIK